MPQLHSMQRAHVGLQTITCTLLLLASLVGLTIVKSQVQIFSLGEQGPDARTFPILALGLLALAAFRSEEHTSELQSLMRISYAVFCLKKKNKKNTIDHMHHTHNIYILK